MTNTNLLLGFYVYPLNFKGNGKHFESNEITTDLGIKLFLLLSLVSFVVSLFQAIHYTEISHL